MNKKNSWKKFHEKIERKIEPKKTFGLKFTIWDLLLYIGIIRDHNFYIVINGRNYFTKGALWIIYAQWSL